MPQPQPDSKSKLDDKSQHLDDFLEGSDTSEDPEYDVPSSSEVEFSYKCLRCGQETDQFYKEPPDRCPSCGQCLTCQPVLYPADIREVEG